MIARLRRDVARLRTEAEKLRIGNDRLCVDMNVAIERIRDICKECGARDDETFSEFVLRLRNERDEARMRRPRTPEERR